jgi:hypothetical protein
VREPTPELTGNLRGHTPTLRLRIPEVDVNGPAQQHLKVRAIAAHRSQTRGDYQSYLFSFARGDEPFFVEHFVRSAGGWIPRNVSVQPAKNLR